MECLLFDLDDTLYPLSSGIAASCRRNIIDFMVHRLGIPSPSDALHLSFNLYKTHGTTMAGLVALGHRFDFDEYHRFVHGRLPYHVLGRDLTLRGLLLSLPQRKLVFTNSDRIHAFEVLSRLGVEDCFEDVICFETFNKYPASRIVCKPSLEAFEHAIRIAGVDARRILFLDDSVRNIEGAKAAGLRTVLVGGATKLVEGGHDCCIHSIHNLREALPELWQDAQQEIEGDEIQSVTDTIVVRA